MIKVPTGKWKIWKYGTGDCPPIGSIYLGTITNEKMNPELIPPNDEDKRYVWHYFMVEQTE